MSTFETNLVNKFHKQKHSWLNRFAVRLLQCCSVPKHIAFILDGNRRYAKSKKISLVDGYGLGGQNVLKIFDVCCEIGVQCFTVYLFSIENFNRPQKEVDNLMEMMHEQLSRMFRLIEELHKKQICIRVWGKLELLPVHIQKLMAQLVLHTADNRKIYLNLCAPYTAREEMVKAIGDLQSCFQDKMLSPDNIDHFIFSSALYSCELPEPDLLVRTSGVRRLSDFLLWQSASSHIQFVEEQWPDFSIYSLFKALLQYTVKLGEITSQRDAQEKNCLKTEYAQFVEMPQNSGCNFEKFCAFKKQQIELFQNHFQQKRIDYFRNIVKQN